MDHGSKCLKVLWDSEILHSFDSISDGQILQMPPRAAVSATKETLKYIILAVQINLGLSNLRCTYIQVGFFGEYLILCWQKMKMFFKSVTLSFHQPIHLLQRGLLLKKQRQRHTLIFW